MDGLKLKAMRMFLEVKETEITEDIIMRTYDFSFLLSPAAVSSF